MEHIIKKIAMFTPDTADERPSCGDQDFMSACDSHNTEHGDVQNYMFFRNLKAMRDHIDQMLNMDASSIDQKLSDEHDWATDHIASAHENIEQVFGWLSADQS